MSQKTQVLKKCDMGTGSRFSGPKKLPLPDRKVEGSQNQKANTKIQQQPTMSSTNAISNTHQVHFERQDAFDDSLGNLSAVTAEFYLDEEDLRPGGEFIKGYKELRTCEDTAFAGVVLKKTRNGKKAKNGFRLERSISPVRPRDGIVSTTGRKNW